MAKLQLSKSEISGPWITLADNLTTNSNFIWNVPNQDASYIFRVIVADSTNPLQTASVTVETKVSPVIRLEVLVMISSAAMMLLSVTLIPAVLSKRLTRNGVQKN